MTQALREERPALAPLTGFDLGALARNAARTRPNHIAVSDGPDARMDYATLDARADAMAWRLSEIGLAPGDVLMIAAGARASSVVALLAGLRAGLDLALAPAHAPVAALAAYAARVGAKAIAGQTSLGDHAPMEDLFEVAARAPDVRLVCGLGPGEFDGVVDLDSHGSSDAPRFEPVSHRRSAIATFVAGGGVVYHDQRTLALAAIDLARRARIGVRGNIVSTLAPASFAGLVAGPYLAWMVDAPLYFVAPFDSSTFIAVLAKLGPAHVIAPGALAGPLAEAGLLRPDLIASLLLLDRTGEARGALAPLGDVGAMGVVDLHAIGEQALIAEPRAPGGLPLPPAREPHMIDIEGVGILAVKRRDGFGPLAFEGEAVSAG